MADQVAIQLPKTVFNERSAFTATAYFRTRASGAASTPTTVHYKLTNLSTRETVTDWTSVSAAGNVSISITGAENKILANKDTERMELLVSIDKGLSTEVVGSAIYRLVNVYGRKD